MRTEALQSGDHVCVLTSGAEDNFAVISQVVTAGLGTDELVVIATESMTPPAVTARLEALGDAERAGLRSGQVRVIPAREIYMSGGRFAPDVVYETMTATIDAALAEGYRGVRVVGDMAWTSAGLFDPGELAGYETSVNRLLLDRPAGGTCLYDARYLGHDLLRQITSAHLGTTTGLTPRWRPLARIRRTPFGLTITGEVDLSNRQALLTVLDMIAEDAHGQADPVVVDVAGLEFVDAATAAALACLAERAPGGIELVGCSGATALILERLGITDLPTVRVLPSEPAS